MRPVVLGFGLVAAGGCAQLAGIDKTTGKGSDAAQLQIARTSVGATVSAAPQDLSQQAAHFLSVADGGDGGFDRTSADLDAATATWSAEIDDPAPEVLFTLPDRNVVHLYDLGREVRGGLVALEHPDPTPGDAAAPVAPTLTLPVAWNGTDTFSLEIVGPWATHAVSTTSATAGTSTQIADSFTYGDFAGPSEAPLAAVTAADATLALQYAGQKLVGAYDQAGLAGDGTIAATMAAVTADQTLAVPIDPAAIAAQLDAGADPPTIAWKVTAAPGAQLGVVDGPRLVAGSVAMADTAIAATYGNPFAAARAWPSTLGVQAFASRTVTIGTSMVTLSRGLSEISDAAAGDAAFPVPNATGATVAGIALAADGTTDGAAVTIDRTAPVAVTVATTGAGDVALYELQLSTIDGDPATRTVTFEAVSRTSSFELPPELFAAGTTYVLSVICTAGGYPAVASGDLQMRALPVAESLFDISTFTVAP